MTIWKPLERVIPRVGTRVRLTYPAFLRGSDQEYRVTAVRVTDFGCYAVDLASGPYYQYRQIIWARRSWTTGNVARLTASETLPLCPKETT